MNRRRFLSSGSTLAVAAAVRPARTLAQAKAGSRTVLPINRGWRYSPKATSEAHQPGFDDSSFERVVVPHSNIPLPWHSFDDKDYAFVSIYRRPLKIPALSSTQRVFVDFEGAMIASTVFLNGKQLGQYKGGYTPFSFELTNALAPAGPNLLSVQLDSTERSDIPPFGYEVDYLTFGGIYREVALRVVPAIFLENIHAETKDVLTNPTVDVACYLDRSPSAKSGALSVQVELHDNGKVIATGAEPCRIPPVTQHHQEDSDQALGALPYDPAKDSPAATVTLKNLTGKVSLWDLATPHLYTVVVKLLEGGVVIDEDTRRIGFREAKFTPVGFSLNGTVIKLHGLDHHQTFPWVGQAMPARVQRQDAKILRKDLHCNIVRTSHYPPVAAFPGRLRRDGATGSRRDPWMAAHRQPAWQDIAVDNVRRMVRRDWNHPSVILWGVRINESKDDHTFYTRTNALAHALDHSRQTGGIRTGGNYNSELLEDVFTVNDFGFPLMKPNHPLYLNTEFVGHTFPTKTFDSLERLREHTIRHARVHDQLASDAQYAGGLGWCAFDYTTHANFGSGERICYHGVMDIFRTPKPAAGFYKSMCEPAEEIVLEPSFHWARNDESIGITYALISSNVEHIKMFTVNADGETLAGEGDPDRKQFAHLKYAPFSIPFIQRALEKPRWGDLRFDGYIGGTKVITRTLSGDGIDHKFVLLPDATSLVADGADTVRVVLRSEDAHGNVRPFANDAITLTLEGPAIIIGDNPFGLIGGTGAIWLRATEQPGSVTLTAKHPRLGTTEIHLSTTASRPERA